MKKCPYCNEELEDRFLFCTNCGKEYKEAMDNTEPSSVDMQSSPEKWETDNSGTIQKTVDIQEDVLFANANKFFELGQYQDAYNVICELMAKCPKPIYIEKKKEYQDRLIETLTKHGDELSRVGQMVLAKENYEKALALQPANAYIISRLDSIKIADKKTKMPIIAGLLFLGMIVVGALAWYVFDKNSVESDVVVSDSVVDEDSNSLVEEEEVVSASEFTTPDLTLFGLKGHVKSVTMTSPEFTQSYFSPKSLKYDEQGMLRSYDDSEEYVRFIFSEDNKTAVRQSDVINGTTRVKKAVSKNYDLVRDSQGRLIKMAPHMQDDEYNMGEYNIVWNSQGFVTEILLSTDGGDPNMTVSYDSNNMPSKIVMSGYTTHEYTITYSEFDSHGNWTKRNVEYYYEAVYDGEEDIHRNFQETRTITYFD